MHNVNPSQTVSPATDDKSAPAKKNDTNATASLTRFSNFQLRCGEEVNIRLLPTKQLISPQVNVATALQFPHVKIYPSSVSSPSIVIDLSPHIAT